MVSRAYIDEQLREVPLFSTCTKKELRQVSRLMTPVDVTAGTELATEGRLGSEFMVIVDGTASVRKKGKKVATLKAGQWFGEVALLDDRHLRTATVVADTDMVLEVVDGAAFTSLVEGHPTIARKLLQGLASLVAEG